MFIWKLSKKQNFFFHGKRIRDWNKKSGKNQQNKFLFIFFFSRKNDDVKRTNINFLKSSFMFEIVHQTVRERKEEEGKQF